MANQWKLSAAMVQSEKRSFVLKVHGYSRAKEQLWNREYMASPPFSVGGHNFVLRYFPNGGYAGHTHSISFLLVPHSADNRDVKVSSKLRVLGTEGVSLLPYSLSPDPFVFTRYGLWDRCDFLHASFKGSRGMIIGDCLTIRCDVTVEKDDIHTEETVGNRFVVVPPSDLHTHFGNLLESMVGADVTFHVGGEEFLAHRHVLAARSPVFKVELYGPMKETAGSPIVIHDMEPRVFKCLLHFIYTDSLQMATGDVAMASHLLVAADRYNVERLKLICEHKLCSRIDASMVANTLVLADQHGCNGLKEACLQFLASPSNLEAMKASGGHEHLKTSSRSALKELIASLLPVAMQTALKDIIMEL